MSRVDLVIAGGTVVDGTGGPARLADVVIAGDRIVAVSPMHAWPAGSRAGAGPESARRLDATGRIVAPGFVDLHTHSDLTILSDGRARSAIHQGVTTHVVGNCGMGVVPSPIDRRAAIRTGVAIIDPDPGVAWSWSDLPGYGRAVAAARPALNVAPLVGHVPLRIAAMGDGSGAPTAGALARMTGALDDALAAGAIGFSTGLMYPPAMFAAAAELEALARTTAAHGGLFAIHMRNYNDRLLEGVDEAIGIARATGVRLQVSHLAVAGRRNWGAVARALERLDAARAQGLDIAQDHYPYLAGSANLSQLLPEWASAGGSDAIVDRLALGAERRRIIDDWATSLFLGWDEIELCAVDPGMEAWLGRTVADVAAAWGRSPAETALDLIVETRNRVMMVAYGRSEADLRAVLGHSATSIGSDGLAMDPTGPSAAGRPHPRSFGCYPRFLAGYARDEPFLDLPTAIAMGTSRPADRAGLTDRGRLVAGAVADVIVFRLDALEDRATFAAPARLAAGVEHVIVNGAMTLEAGTQRDDVRAGRVLARSSRAAGAMAGS